MIDSRGTPAGRYIRRRRVCSICDYRYTTWEILSQSRVWRQQYMARKFREIEVLLHDLRAELRED